jgi:hypothetical protein
MPYSAWPSLLVAFPLFFGGTSPEEGLPLPLPREGLVFSGDTNEVTLGYLLDELARATGQELALSSADRDELSREKITLTHMDQVPAGEMYSFVESFLALQGVVIAPLKGGARPVLAVYLPGQGRRGPPIAPEPLPISQALFDEAAEHPALFVRIQLVLKHTDTRQLQTQLRQMLVDPIGIQNVVPAGERGLLLQGRAKFIVGLARQILELDEAFGRGEPAKLPTLEATEGAR